jgi:glycosyltransferase involved in cell wall biosynthesis
MYGTDELPNFTKSIRRSKFVKYEGAFSSFSDIPLNDFDLFVYTSAYDGTPNVLVEAISSGIPVVAPDIGGVASLGKGLISLVDPSLDSDLLVSSYVNQILLIYSEWECASQNAKHLMELTLNERSIDAHRNSVEKHLF